MTVDRRTATNREIVRDILVACTILSLSAMFSWAWATDSRVASLETDQQYTAEALKAIKIVDEKVDKLGRELSSMKGYLMGEKRSVER